MEAELEEERKQRSAAMNARKKLEGDLKEMESQVEMANKVKEDSVRQLRKLQNSFKDMQREAEDALLSRDEMAAHMKENDKKVRSIRIDECRLKYLIL